LNAVSGYAGGDAATATYSQVSGGNTGHAEAVQITFDPKQVSLAQLMHIFFSVVHDPTELNRQGPDTGTEYRSAVFFSDEAQQQGVKAYIAQLDAAKAFPRARRDGGGATQRFLPRRTKPPELRHPTPRLALHRAI
jgi:peptide-methionine (S)-S-oxide reductase